MKSLRTSLYRQSIEWMIPEDLKIEAFPRSLAHPFDLLLAAQHNTVIANLDKKGKEIKHN